MNASVATVAITCSFILGVTVGVFYHEFFISTLDSMIVFGGGGDE
jgi:hypothetical protein